MTDFEIWPILTAVDASQGERPEDGQDAFAVGLVLSQWEHCLLSISQASTPRIASCWGSNLQHDLGTT